MPPRCPAFALLVALAFAATAADAATTRPAAADAVRLVAALADADPAARDRAAAELLRLGPAAEPALQRGLLADDPEVAARCARVLAAIRDGVPLGLPAALAEAVAEYRRAEDPRQRASIARRIGELGPHATSALLDLLAIEPDPLPRYALGRALTDDLVPLLAWLVRHNQLALAEGVLFWAVLPPEAPPGVVDNRRPGLDTAGGRALSVFGGDPYAVLLLERGTLPAAVERWRHITDRGSKFAVWRVLANLERIAGHTAEAAALFDRIGGSDGRDVVRLWIDAGDLRRAAEAEAQRRRNAGDPTVLEVVLRELSGDPAAEAAAQALARKLRDDAGRDPREAASATSPTAAALVDLGLPDQAIEVLLAAGRRDAAALLFAARGQNQRLLDLPVPEKIPSSWQLHRTRALLALGRRDDARAELLAARDAALRRTAEDVIPIIICLREASMQDLADATAAMALAEGNPAKLGRGLAMALSSNPDVHRWYDAIVEADARNEMNRQRPVADRIAFARRCADGKLEPHELAELIKAVEFRLARTRARAEEAAAWWQLLGDAARALGRNDLARDCYRRWSTLPQDAAEAPDDSLRAAAPAPAAAPVAPRPPSSAEARRYGVPVIAAEGWLRLGDLAAAEGAWREAARCYVAATEADPLHAVASALAGEALQQAGLREEGRAFKQAARLLPTDLAGRRPAMAAAYRRRGMLVEARREDQLILRAAPLNSIFRTPVIERLLADALAEGDAFAAASLARRAFLERVVAGHSSLRDRHRYHALQALALIKEGHKDLGLAQARRAQALIPSDPAPMNAARALLRQRGEDE